MADAEMLLFPPRGEAPGCPGRFVGPHSIVATVRVSLLPRCWRLVPFGIPNAVGGRRSFRRRGPTTLRGHGQLKRKTNPKNRTAAPRLFAPAKAKRPRVGFAGP